MQVGLDHVLRTHPRLFKGKRLGILAHPASIDKNYRHILEILEKESGAKIEALFGPEHGFDGHAQDMESVFEKHTTSKSGPQIYSLYGSTYESLKPQKSWLNNIEVLVCDMQDVGSRYYTFIYTLAFCMEVAQQTGTHIVVLDRPNPINGYNVEGNLVSEKFRSFVGYFPLTNRHGMTIGELAQLFREEFNLKCKLTAIPMKGWHRRRYFDELKIPWVFPSPNMPTVETAVVYPGMCLLEGTELSEGRGTTRPFEIFGAPFIDGEKLVKRLHEFRLPGVRFRPLSFKPGFQKHAGKICNGAQIHVTRRKAFLSLLTGVAILKATYELYPNEFQWRHRAYEFVEDIPAIDLLSGNKQLREAIEAGAALKKIQASWEEEKESFLKIRKNYLIYT
ncbi:MAG: DUF1343 domain-containing protein [Deltaproteobacteria bacterium]|nr:DUF1343 domain-containing protein [Deltaproteobacteria bacterium]